MRNCTAKHSPSMIAFIIKTNQKIPLKSELLKLDIDITTMLIITTELTNTNTNAAH